MGAQLGFYGLGVMGKNLCLNLLDHEVRLCVADYLPANTQALASTGHPLLMTADSEEAMCAQLEKPRRIFLMIKAGSAVDQTIERFLPWLEPGDILMDGGNSYFLDTVRRYRELSEKGIRYLGIGVSGGAYGARNGPALMVGGDKSAYDLMALVLTAIAAKVGDDPCCDYVGEDGAGHFVKTVHNGIEYADMQLISEVYDLACRGRGLPPAVIGEMFAKLNTGVAESYLMTITAEILGTTDPMTGEPLVFVVGDQAVQNGTGSWAAEQALRLGMPATLLSSAVFARSRSADRDLRRQVAATMQLEPRPSVDFESAEADPASLESLARALLLGRILTYAEGFCLMKAAAANNNWSMDLSAVARIFRGGCIIRSGLLEPIAKAYTAQPDLSHLLADPDIAALASTLIDGLVETTLDAVRLRLPVPVLTAAASELAALNDLNLPTSLIQAQRDYFGSHTFRRKDREGRFHFNYDSQTIDHLPG